MIPEYVYFTTSGASTLESIIENGGYSKVGILCDENTRQYCLPKLNDYFEDLPILQIESGEINKNLNTCTQIWQAMTNWQFDRKSVLINLGGGVIGDMGGFCAATFKRGIDFIQVPTTLLAQVDASVGGKLGVDFTGLKNHVGVFKEPASVVIDPVFLDTLPPRQHLSGFAEMIKHGLINDKEVYTLLRNKGGMPDNALASIENSVSIKGRIVNSDPFEEGPRKLLNFGHTIGHAIESHFLLNDSKELLHGEAIAIGMICESWLSVKKLGLPETDLEDISNFLINLYGKTDLSEMSEGEFFERLMQDKKNKGNSILFALLQNTGEGKYNIEVSPDEALRSLEYYQGLNN